MRLLEAISNWTKKDKERELVSSLYNTFYKLGLAKRIYFFQGRRPPK